jgi:hypothetical protein
MPNAPTPFPPVNPAAAILLDEIRVTVIVNTRTGGLQVQANRPDVSLIAVADILTSGTQTIIRKILSSLPASTPPPGGDPGGLKTS